MIGEYFVESHREELRAAGSTKTPGDVVAKFSALGERQRIAETEGHSNSRHGVVVSGHVSDQYALRVPVRDARPELIDCGVELPRPQSVDERGPYGLRQQTGIRFPHEAQPVPGSPAVQRNIGDDPDAIRRQAVYERRARASEHHVPETFERQACVPQRDAQHSRARRRLRRQAQRSTHDRGPAIGAHNP